MTEDELIEITEEFGEVYKSVKGFKVGGKRTDGWEQLLKDAQTRFFEAATSYWESQPLARKTVKLPSEVSGEEEIRTWVKVYHPAWRLVSVSEDGSKAILEEDPQLKKFAWINHRDEMVYQRSQTESGPSLDVDRLREEDPETFLEITEWPKGIRSIALAALTYAYSSVHNHDPESVAETALDSFLTSNLDLSIREIRDQSEWTPEQSAKLKPYWIPGTVSVRLTPPRPATKIELETGEVE